MKFMKKLLSAVTAAAIGATMTTALSAGVSTASAASKTAVELVEDMGLGWNLGNALDCTNTWTDPPHRNRSKPLGGIFPPPRA